ncbi:MAG: M28 family peptidase [Planctomycetes bacterium]|nr:M28 family peptidase [Planctomycetota bacterium]
MPSFVSRRTTLGLFATLAIAATCTQCSGPSGPIDGDKAMAHVKAQVAFGPRPFGSDALAKTTDYLEGELKKLGLSPQRHEVMHDKEKKTIRNLYVQIDGEDPKAGPILMLGAHYDTKLAEGHTGADAQHNFRFVGAIDGGGGPAVLLELARALKDRTPKPKCNVWLYWIDAEESIDWVWAPNSQRALLGSKAFCKKLSEDKTLSRVKAFVLLDLVGSKDFKVDKDGRSETRLMTIVEKAAAAMGATDRVYQFPTPLEIENLKRHARENNRPEAWGITDDHNVFTDYGVPSVLLIDFERRIPGTPQALPKTDFHQWWHTAEDDLPAMDPDALAFYGNLVMQAFPDLEAFVMGRK